MALMGCVGSKAHDALIQALEEAVKENALTRVGEILQDGRIGSEAINDKNLLHQAVWLGYPTCAKLLLDQGADPNLKHKKNGCTPMHLAHFCTIEDSNAKETITALLAAGADINNRGSPKCGRYPIHHAIQHQKVHSVHTLLQLGSKAPLEVALIAIDVANPQILDMLLKSGADCSTVLSDTLYWGEILDRVLSCPLKCPRECYKQLFHMTVQATVCRPIPGVTNKKTLSRQPSRKGILNNLRSLAQDSVDLTRYFYVFLLRNGLHPNEELRNYGKTLGEPDWLDNYLTSPVSLKESCVRVLRSYLILGGNVTYGAKKLQLPATIQEYLLFVNPF